MSPEPGYGFSYTNYNFELPMSEEDMDITIHGNFFASMTEAFKDFYLKDIRHQLKLRIDHMLNRRSSYSGGGRFRTLPGVKVIDNKLVLPFT